MYLNIDKSDSFEVLQQDKLKLLYKSTQKKSFENGGFSTCVPLTKMLKNGPVHFRQSTFHIHNNHIRQSFFESI